ncbi:hypothetical protein CRM22_000551 [Opisthorchis felineus]|uniref:Uncharacterized protein n=1 Tax=Opisthorchis felineus TaxID=147828 RepID=A0A4V6RH90_OPIFE|nr:hypothetical protein CRM22_000551 [Opisthorchis felineus]
MQANVAAKGSKRETTFSLQMMMMMMMWMYDRVDLCLKFLPLTVSCMVIAIISYESSIPTVSFPIEPDFISDSGRTFVSSQYCNKQHSTKQPVLKGGWTVIFLCSQTPLRFLKR